MVLHPRDGLCAGPSYASTAARAGQVGPVPRTGRGALGDRALHRPAHQKAIAAPRAGRVLQIVFLTLLVAALVQAEKQLPRELGTLPLTHLVDGPAALREIGRLHGGPFEVASAFVAHYGGGDANVTLYVSRAASEAEAGRGDRMIWVAADRAWAERALAAALEGIR